MHYKTPLCGDAQTRTKIMLPEEAQTDMICGTFTNLAQSAGTSNIRISPSGVSNTIGRMSKGPRGDGGTQPLATIALVSPRFALSPITDPSSSVYAAYRVCVQ